MTAGAEVSSGRRGRQKGVRPGLRGADRFVYSGKA